MAQLTTIDFDTLDYLPLRKSSKQHRVARAWRQMGRFAAAVARGLRRWAQLRHCQVLLPPDVLDRQLRIDYLRADARRVL